MPSSSFICGKAKFHLSALNIRNKFKVYEHRHFFCGTAIPLMVTFHVGTWCVVCYAVVDVLRNFVLHNWKKRNLFSNKMMYLFFVVTFINLL
jgi:hypothetical protein